MNRRDKEPRQSSLPSSLIPHLYSAPQQPRDSSTRTTLEAKDPTQQDRPPPGYLHPVSPAFSLGTALQSPPFDHRRNFLSYEPSLASLDISDRQLSPTSSGLPDISSTAMYRTLQPSPSTSNPSRFVGPIYSDPAIHASSRPGLSSRNHNYTFPPPPMPRDVMSQRASWREGEAGPSSLLHPTSHGQGSSRRRRGSSQPPRETPQSDNFGRGTATSEQQSSFGELLRRDAERDNYLSLSGPPLQTGGYGSQFQALPPPPQLLIPTSGDLSFSFDRNDAYSYPAVGSLSTSAPSSADLRGPESPDMQSMYRSDSRSVDMGSTDGDGSQKGKRRRTESVETYSNARKSRNPRKTAVACNFCRGRKLRCNGAKPSCYNCTVRKFDCEYVPIQRRRGPGKAPKGSRSKKTSASRSDPSGSGSSINVGDHPPSTVPEYELDALAPELRPYTSVLSLDNFGFHPPDPSPQYPSAPDAYLMREYYSRARTPRSRETSSEDRSEAEEMYRKMA